MEESLVVVDEERGGLFLGEGRQARVFAALTAQLDALADDVRQTQARLELIKESVVETHMAMLARCGPTSAIPPLPLAVDDRVCPAGS